MDIKIENITEAQENAFKQFFARLAEDGKIKNSELIGFFVDGENTFSPVIIVNGEKPEYVVNDIYNPIQYNEKWMATKILDSDGNFRYSDHIYYIDEELYKK